MYMYNYAIKQLIGNTSLKVYKCLTLFERVPNPYTTWCKRTGKGISTEIMARNVILKCVGTSQEGNTKTLPYLKNKLEKKEDYCISVA